MSWTTGPTDLRTLISDGAQDKFNFQKTIFGIQNAVNRSFKTLEIRRVTDFSTPPPAPLGIYVNGAIVTVSADAPLEGVFTLTAAPAQSDTVRASYYSQWFLDAELVVFLTTAVGWLISGDDYTQVDPGLRPATLHYAAAECYAKLALRFSRLRSDEYRAEDEIDKARAEMIKSYNETSAAERKLAEELRAQFYTRNDQPKAPLFASLVGSVPSVQPKR